VLVVATEWRSAHGGLSTFSRQLCLALAAAGATVYCQVLAASPEEVSEAAGQGVQLRTPPASHGLPEAAELARKPRLEPGDTPDVVIGHGRVTGPAARSLAEDHFPGAKRIHFVHMAPDEIEWHKLDRSDDAGDRAEERTAAEVTLGRTAYRLAAVGPTLHKRFTTELYGFGNQEPLRIDPGFDSLLSVPREPPPGSPWRVLMLGRMEDADLKGLDLAARAIGAAARNRGAGVTPIELIVRGAPSGATEELRRQLIDWSGWPSLNVVVRKYSADTELLSRDLRMASLVVMPSRSEGFGLVGAEAIVAGTPVLISSNSGLAGCCARSCRRTRCASSLSR